VASKYWRIIHVLGSTDADLKLAAMTTAQLKAWLKRPEGERGMFTPIKVQTEVALRTSSAAVCLVFVLLGIPVALRFRRSDRLGAFLAAFLLALFLYFPSVKVAKALSLSGALSPHLAVWMGHVLMLVAGLLFSRKLAHR
jgi:lipopolysaccharide export LptBFGC system permease protein LptF